MHSYNFTKFLRTPATGANTAWAPASCCTGRGPASPGYIRTWPRWRALAPIAVIGGLFTGCGGEAEGTVATPYRPGNVVLVGDEKGGELTTVGGCTGDACSDVEKDCGESGAADVILDDKGNVIDVICYRQDVVLETVTADEVDEVSAGNDTVVVLDAEDDGVDVKGDLTIEGNNAVVYGAGPDTSVIGGTLDIQKNDAIIRGVRIKQDVTIIKNNTKLVFCVIEGDLTITGNNTTLAECDVYGKVTITGLNTVLVQNRFQGVDEIEGFNLECNENFRFDDENEDFSVSDPELGGEVTCSEAEGTPDPQADADDVTPTDAGM